MAFCSLKNIWKSNQISTNTKIRLFNTNVKAVLLYGSETWRTTKAIMKKVQTFTNNCLRKLLKVRWPATIKNEDLWRQTKQTAVNEEIKKRKWGWIGHTLRKPPETITRQALTWNPQGQRKRGRPRNSWRRDLETETKKIGHSWKE